MSIAIRLILGLGVAAAVLVTLAGPRWRGSFYRSWLKPRLVAFGIIVVLLATASYLYRVVNALHAHG
ncbi:MAG TPA: hypothetical protein VLS53_07020 [Candidatus Dormibacteraeota bacterium]|nr:hypothetical protein [Candidatus Dormibacteraeota bacterium]